MRRFGLARYLKTNSGVFAFRTETARELMEACRRCFLEEAQPRLRWSILRGAWLGDEIAFGVVGGRMGWGTFPPPAPMYWPFEFPGLDLDHPPKPLLHLIWPPEPELLERLLRDMRRRREEAAVAGSGEAMWREEVRKLQRMRSRRRMLERIGWW